MQNPTATIDPHRVQELVELGGYGLIRRLQGVVAASSLQYLTRIRECEVPPELDVIREEAHRLRGLALNMGLGPLAAASADLERVIDPVRVTPLLEVIDAELFRALNAIAALVSRAN